MAAGNGGGAGGEEVETFHRALFLHRHGAEIERVRQERGLAEDRLTDLEARWRSSLEAIQDQRENLPVEGADGPDVRPNAPWNAWDAGMFAAAAAGIVFLLTFGVMNVSFNLIESGIATFVENPLRAYLWAALLPVGALAVKVGWDFLGEGRRRAAYLWACLAVGVLAVFVWVGAYASVYPSLSKSTDEMIGSLRVFDEDGSGDPVMALGGGGAKILDMILVTAQSVAEVCLSAVLGMYMTQLYARHRPVRMAPNPLFGPLNAERARLDEQVGRERRAVAEARGSEVRLENQMTAFVAYARALYQRELALREDRGHRQRLALERIAEDLRNRLAEVNDGIAAPSLVPVDGEDGGRTFRREGVG